ncbi:hypothetical protein [Enterococcus mundtii]|uniref:Uncharacterized protein n=1 Tax=Enterococcus mundtii TaxID=53346 RepID=A0A2S7RQ16_ENTMU|nr:hypothetical protein [Enterococcus mundtii]PQF21687.1 hypothetical protein CUS89_13055 [Enterococcus mundtii]
MNIAISDEFQVELAKKQYDNLKLTNSTALNKDKMIIGYVSHINSKITGEQSFIIIDNYVPLSAPLSEGESVKEVTVLYRGSSFDSSLDAELGWR